MKSCRLAPTERMRPVVFWLEDIKNDQGQVVLVIFGAASQIRTGDLILTNYGLAIAPHSGECEKSLLLLHKSHIAITGNDVA